MGKLGTLVLKPDIAAGKVSKKKKRKGSKRTKMLQDGSDAGDVGATDATPSTQPGLQHKPGSTGNGRNYEDEFEFETARANSAKAKATAWGVSYRAPPAILHGYDRKVTGRTFQERLDLRCAKKADKMCK